jgi:Fe-S-cluster-containing dehydrogenase component
MKAFVVDVAMCNGCYNCRIACKTSNLSRDIRLRVGIS